MKTKRQIHTLDATGQSLGRLAVQIALLLRGKQKATFQPNIDAGDFVVVKNIAQVKFTGKKLKQKKYYHHTGYAKGFREVAMEKIFNRDPGEVLRRAVRGMLPVNKLRSEQIKRLKCQ